MKDSNTRLFPHAITQLDEIKRNLSEARDHGVPVILFSGNQKRLAWVIQDLEKLIGSLKLIY